jgi:hypothetical protein
LQKSSQRSVALTPRTIWERVTVVSAARLSTVVEIVRSESEVVVRRRLALAQAKQARCRVCGDMHETVATA